MTKTAKSTGIFVLALACSLTFSACASPLAPSAMPENFYEAVRSDAEGFWTDYFSSHGGTYTPISKMRYFTGLADTPCGVMEGPYYCSADGGVVGLDSEFMQTQMSTFGKFGPAMIIAHEIGHHTQALLGLLRAPSIVKELQADCLAGSWVKDAGARGLLEEGDYVEAWNNFLSLGSSPWNLYRTHGTVEERQSYFQKGFRLGAGGC